MAFDPVRMIFGRSSRALPSRVPLSGNRREAIQRLQIGFFGLGAMVLLVGLASIIMRGVQETEATAVPEAAPTVAATQTPAPARDPLAEAGVVPDLPAEPEPAATAVTRPGPVVPAAPPANSDAQP